MASAVLPVKRTTPGVGHRYNVIFVNNLQLGFPYFLRYGLLVLYKFRN